MTKKPTVVGGINLTTKVKSKGFWVATVPIIATFITSILSLLGVEVAEEVINQYTAIAGVIISLLAQFGVLVDFNTKGIKDSPIVQGYTAPRNSNNPDEHIEYIKNMPQNEEWVDGNAHEVTENVQGLRDVDQEEVNEELANEAPIGLDADEKASDAQAPNSIPQEQLKQGGK
nr:MAG TPA: holin [Herelleviridae sp.]